MLLLPAAYFMEKEGTISGSGRMVQWRYAAVKPPGQAKADLEIVDTVFRKVRELYRDSRDAKDEPLAEGGLELPAEGQRRGGAQGDQRRRSEDRRARQGHRRAAGRRLDLFGGVDLRRASSASGKNLTKRRDHQTDPSGLGMYPGFAWSWPGNMKMLYNRASCDADGKPFADAMPMVWWDAAQKKWVGHDTPDVPVPTDGPDTPNGQRPSA